MGPSGLFFLFLFGLLLPIIAFRARDRLTRLRPWPTRRRLYTSIVMQLSLFLILGLLTAWQEDVDVWRRAQRVWLPGLITLALY